MKKVIALALAVLMLATVAFAIPSANIVPSDTIRIGRDRGPAQGDGTVGVNGGGSARRAQYLTITAETEDGTVYDINGNSTAANVATNPGIENILLRSVNSDNYSLTNVKYTKGGKNLVSKVELDNANDAVKIVMKDDLNNTSVKDFEITFKLKGKTKYTIRTDSEWFAFDGTKKTSTVLRDTGVGASVSLPDVDFKVVGTVGYGKVEVPVGSDDIDELENLNGTSCTSGGGTIDFDTDIIKFTSGTTQGYNRVAGAYTADAILTEEYDAEGLTLEARVYSNDTLYLGLVTDPDDPLVDTLEDVSADIDFFYFTDTDTSFVHFNSNAKVIFENADEDCYVYQVKNGKLFPFGEYSDEDGCWVGTTRTLGQYVVSTEELSQFEGSASEDPGNANPDTGANDVVGIATALAAVALVSAAAVSLKK